MRPPLKIAPTEARRNLYRRKLAFVSGREQKNEKRLEAPATAPPGSSLQKVHRTFCGRSALWSLPTQEEATQGINECTSAGFPQLGQRTTWLLAPITIGGPPDLLRALDPGGTKQKTPAQLQGFTYEFPKELAHPFSEAMHFWPAKFQ